jgi:hypothetical protein
MTIVMKIICIIKIMTIVKNASLMWRTIATTYSATQKLNNRIKKKKIKKK